MKLSNFPIFFFLLRSLYLQKGVFHMTVGCRAGVVELGNRLGLGFGLWADYPFDSVYELEKIICNSVHSWLPLFCQIFSHGEHLMDRCWSLPGRDQNCSSKEQSRVQDLPDFQDTAWGWSLFWFISQPSAQSPSLQTCSQLSAFSLGYFHFSYITVLWNFWSWSIVDVPSLEVFKVRLDRALSSLV